LKKKKSVSLMLAATMMATLAAGCSSKTGGEATPAPTSAPATASAAPSEKPKEKVEITFWHVYSDKDAGPLNERVEAFNKMQDRIVVKSLGNQDATKQLTAISGGNPPDIALTFWNNVGPWSEAGAVLDLDELFKRDNYDKGQFHPAAIDRMKVGDKYYGLPFTMSMSNTLMYNKKAFADAGITAPPETVEQLFDYAKKLTKRDGSGNITQIGFIPDYPWIDNVFWPVIFGGSWVDANGKVTPNKKENVDSIAYQRKFYEEFGKDAIDKFKSGMGKRGTPQDPLITGQLAMIVGWEYSYVDNRKDGSIGVASFPYPAARPDLKGSGMVSPRGVFIPKKAKHQDEAWEFMKYLVGKDSQVEFAVDTKTIPTIVAALDDPRLKTEDMKLAQPFYEWAKSPNLQGFPNSIYINQYLQSLTEETEKALKGTQTAQQAMDKVAEKIQPLADKANK